jgi:nucleoside-diphosphate-sugar epimerase
MVRCFWHRTDVLFLGRRDAGPGWLRWDMLTGPAPFGREMAGGVMLCLAGGVPGGAAEPDRNTDLAMAACAAARAAEMRHVFLTSSAAIYGAAPPGGRRLVEEDVPAPLTEYGRTKLEMERAVASRRGDGLGVTVLRIGNVIGSDALVGADPDPAVMKGLDPVAGGVGPVRSYIGPGRLSRVLEALVDLALAGQALPEVLNIAAVQPVAMGALLDAAGLRWRANPPNPAVIPVVALDTGRLEALLPGLAGDGSAQDLVADWQDWQRRRAA